MEKIQNSEDPYRRSFESYMTYFPLTEEDLQKSILDVGAGNGEFIEYVRTKLGNEAAFAIEKQERRISSEKTGHVVGDGEELPFPDNSFEIVLAKNYLPMFVDKPDQMQEVLLELIRVTKEGGRIMGDISTPSEEERALDEEAKRGIYRATKWLEQRLEGSKLLEKFLEELKEQGFQIELRKGGKNGIVAIIQKP